MHAVGASCKYQPVETVAEFDVHVNVEPAVTATLAGPVVPQYLVDPMAPTTM